jgi:hypothetical protein
MIVLGWRASEPSSLTRQLARVVLQLSVVPVTDSSRPRARDGHARRAGYIDWGADESAPQSKDVTEVTSETPDRGWLQWSSCTRQT